MTAWVRSGANPILRPGVAGPAAKLALNIADPHALWDGSKWRVWFAAAFDQNGVNPPTESRVAMNCAEGATLETLSVVRWGSLLPTCMTGGSLADWDYTNVEAGCVIRNPLPTALGFRRWLMFYSGGNTKAGTVPSGQPYYAIGLAYSADGRNFIRIGASESPYGKAGLLLMGKDFLPGAPSTVTALAADPTVIAIGKVLMLWASLYAWQEGVFLTAGVSLTVSPDGGKRWVPEESNPLRSLWRGEIAVSRQPTVVNNGTGLEMLFTGDTDDERDALPCPGEAAVGFYKATSANGKDWDVEWAERDFAGDGSAAESANLITGAGLAMKGAERHLLYSAYSANNVPPALDLPVVWQLLAARA